MSTRGLARAPGLLVAGPVDFAARHDLPGDPRHNVQEPPLDLIARQLDQHGHPGETALWRSVLHQAQSTPLP